jgi:hypothetical protein
MSYSTNAAAHTFYTTGRGSGLQFAVTTTASAVNYVQVTGAATGGAPTISPQGSDGNITLTLVGKGTGGVRTQFYHQVGTSYANYLSFTGNATTVSPVISVLGSDTDIDLTLTPKGTGNIRFGTLTATADTAISGYITIKDSGGTLRKLAVIT